jgi:hypothetical protein
MKRLSTPLRFAFTLLVITLLGACLPGGQGPSSEEIAQQIGTAVAQTIEAQGQIATSVALTVAAQQAEEEGPLPTPTLIRAEPLPTLTPILPTATPFVIAPSTSGGGGGGGGGGTNPSAEYSCDIIRQRPIDNTEFRRKHTFDAQQRHCNLGSRQGPGPVGESGPYAYHASRHYRTPGNEARGYVQGGAFRCGSSGCVRKIRDRLQVGGRLLLSLCRFHR